MSDHVYMIRHQAGGFLPEFIFAQEPNDEQLAPIRLLMAYRHGVEHPVLRGEEMWLRVYKMDLILGTAVPVVVLPNERAAAVDGGEATKFVASGEGHVG